MIKRWRRWQDWYVLGLGLAILAISCLIYLGHLSFLPLVFQRLEALAYDLRMRLTVQETVRSNPPILIVDIDERSLLAEGQWPWSRYKLAKLVEELHTAGAAVIAFDMTFPEPELNPLDEIKERLGSDFTLAPDLSSQYTRLDGDAHFAQAMQGRNVVLGSLFHQADSFQKGSLQKTAVTWSAQAIPNTALLMHGYTANLSKLTEAASLSGFLNIFPDDDGVIRSAPLVMEFNQQLYPSLALQAVRQYLDEANQPINLLTAKVGEFEEIGRAHV